MKTWQILKFLFELGIKIAEDIDKGTVTAEDAKAKLLALADGFGLRTAEVERWLGKDA